MPLNAPNGLSPKLFTDCARKQKPYNRAALNPRLESAASSALWSGAQDLRREFATTHWSVVLRAGQDDQVQSAAALEKLCRAYWYPLYAYVRRCGYSPEAAQDLTQEFFSRVLEKRLLEMANPD